MTFWVALKNIGTIISLLRSVSEAIGFVAKQKEMPQAYMVRDVLNHVRTLLDKGAIDIPGVDERDISEALRQINEQLCKDGRCELPQGK